MKNKSIVKSNSNSKKVPKLGYGETSRNVNTLRKIEKANHDERYTENGERYLTSTEVSAKYSKLSLAKKNEILYEAIDIMQQYNGRSRFDCIAKAMGYSNQEGLQNTYFKKS